MCPTPLYSFACRDLNEAAQELRLLLCRKAQKEGKERVTVVTACGIFVNDILEAAPIDKYFEMFKPGSGDEGGYVRLKMQMISDDELRARQSGANNSCMIAQAAGLYYKLACPQCPCNAVSLIMDISVRPPTQNLH